MRCFLDYKMVDSKTVVSQVQELQVILHEIHYEEMMLSKTFQVAATIVKLPLEKKISRITSTIRERK